MPGESRRWLPVALVVAVVLGVASSVGAQVDSANPTGTAVWGASCLTPGRADLVLYGRGWAAGPVALEATSEGAGVIGVGVAQGGSPSGTGATFQTSLALGVPAAGSVRVAAVQGERRAEHTVAVAGSCGPTVTAVVGSSCAPPGGLVPVNVTVRGAPSSDFDLLLHHADLYGPAETVDRRQPPRPSGAYAFPLSVPNAPSRVVPITVEARRPGGGFTYATSTVGLPPACAQPNTTAPTSPTTASATTQPPGATTTSSPPPGPSVPVPPFSFQPGTPGQATQASLALVPALGRAGEATTVAGRGFTPSSTVTLRWRPGIGQWTVRAGGDGSFRTQVLVLPNDLEGRRVLEVLEGGAAPASYLVVPGSDQPAFGGVFIRG